MMWKGTEYGLSTINPDILVLKSVGVSGAGTYTYSAGQNSCVANATGTGTAANKCKCIDGEDVNTTSTIGPTVTGTSISPCATNVPTATSTITITFSEALNPSTVSTGTINTYFPGSPPVTVALTSPTVVTITIGAALGANSPQEIIVTTGVQSAKGVAMNPASCSAAAGSLPAATTAYDLRFTTGADFGGMAACVSCSVGGSACQSICSDPKLSSDNAYHCLKADLRVGNAANPLGKEVTVKVGETVFFDARTYSADPSYTSFKTDVPSTDSSFKNGIDRYEMCYNSDSFTSCNAAWTSYGCSEPGAPCNVVMSFLGNAVNALWGKCGLDTTSYSSPGKYKATLWVRSGQNCDGAANDQVIINVNP